MLVTIAAIAVLGSYFLLFITDYIPVSCWQDDSLAYKCKLLAYKCEQITYTIFDIRVFLTFIGEKWIKNMIFSTNQVISFPQQDFSIGRIDFQIAFSFLKDIFHSRQLMWIAWKNRMHESMIAWQKIDVKKHGENKDGHHVHCTRNC